MTDFVLRALEFGVLGLCAITLLLVWRIIKTEQGREGQPRQGILQACYVFMRSRSMGSESIDRA